MPPAAAIAVSGQRRGMLGGSSFLSLVDSTLGGADERNAHTAGAATRRRRGAAGHGGPHRAFGHRSPRRRRSREEQPGSWAGTGDPFGGERAGTDRPPDRRPRARRRRDAGG